jgi:hypothetical protein
MSWSKTTVITYAPDPPPPRLECPQCSGPLAYQHSVIGGVQPRERWDLFECSTCGPFEYRHRTHRLRPAVDVAPFPGLSVESDRDR